MEPAQIVLRATARLYQRISAQFILIAAFFGLVYFLVYFTINSSFAFRLFDGTFNTSIRGRLTWTRISWGPLPWQIQVLEPVLRDPAGRPMISAEQVRVDEIHLFDLIDGAVRADGVHIERPVIHLVRRVHPEAFDGLGRPAEMFNIQEFPWPPGPLYDDGSVGGGPDLDFEGVQIEDATLKLDTMPVGITCEHIDVADARFQLRFDDWGRPRIQIAAARTLVGAASVRVKVEDRAEPALQAPPDAVFEWPITEFKAEHFRWFGDEFAVAKVIARVRGDRLMISRYRMRLDTPDVPYLAGKVHLSTDSVARQLEPLGVHGLDGQALLVVSGQGEVDAFEGEVDVEAEALDVFGVPVDRVRVEALRSARNHMTLRTLDASAFGGHVGGYGAFDAPKGRAFAALDLRGIDPMKLPVPFEGDVARLLRGRLSGPVNARIVDIFSNKPTVSASTDLVLRRGRDRVFGVGDRVEARAAARLNDHKLTIFGAVAETAGERVQGAGRVDLDARTARLDGRARVDALSAVMSGFGVPLDGAARVDWHLRGPLDDPQIDAAVEGRRVVFDRFPAADVDTNVRYAKGNLELDRTILTTAHGEARVRGRIGVGRKGLPLDLKIDARAIDLDALPLGEDLGGRADAQVTVKGPARRLRVEGAARVARPRWRKLALQRLDVAGLWSGDRIAVERLSLKDENLSELASAQGELSLSARTFDATVDLARVPLALANAFVGTPEDELPLRGALSAHLIGAGSFTDPRITDSQITLHQVGYGEYDVGDGKLGLTAGGQMISVAGELAG
ncbi:MAG: hypothetical protein KC620_21560, partial [Myxococcales bacterium]|nr:hypothetical protein [Myxococcales bacterium]